jgi:hypothetical protein
MAYYRDLREYLDALREAGKLRVIAEEINKDTELHPLVRWQFRGLAESEWSSWLFGDFAAVQQRIVSQGKRL